MADIEARKQKMRELAMAYYVEGLNWQNAAAAVGIGDRTVYRWKKSDEFAAVVQEIVEELEAEAIPVALTTLIRQARADNVAAASKLLDIYKGILARHGDSKGGPLTIEVLFGANGREAEADTD